MIGRAANLEGPEAARARAFRLVHDIQAGDPKAVADLSALKQRAEAHGWGDVERACLFGDVVTAWFGRDKGLADAIEVLLQRSQRDGDHVMTALALAMRADRSSAGEGSFSPSAPDADLARAVVMLEDADGGVLERISAHTACGIAFGNRWLWDLGNDQYTTALAIGAQAELGELDFILAPVAFNRSEDQVSWAGVLRQLGDADGVAERQRAFAVASAAASRFAMPAPWRHELAALGTLMAAIAGADVAVEARQRLAELVPGPAPSARAAGHLKLALALSEASAGRQGATQVGEDAVAAIIADDFPHMYDLALFLAAELEARSGPGAGLRCARQLVARNWATRLARLGSMRARIEAERLATEHSVLARQVNLDALTGVGNRRALARFLDDLRVAADSAIALILVDLDDFKDVNDRYGHAVGDAVLTRVARLLEHNSRHVDLAVRLGGDEFALLLAGAGLDVARARAESLMYQVDREPWEDLAPGLQVTLSIGVAAGAVAGVDTVSASADSALYGAKDAGGHRIVFAGPQ